MVKRSRLKRGSKKQKFRLSKADRKYLIGAMTQSEKEFAEIGKGKPVQKFTDIELASEMREIMATYPQEDWGDIRAILKRK